MNPEINTKLLKVTLEYEDKIMTIEGAEAEKWNNYNLAVAQLAQLHNMNPFKDNPINWNIEHQLTIYEWLQQLPEPIKDKAIRNLYDENKDLRRESLADAIYCAFVFEYTPEGHNYWVEIANQYLGFIYP
jgi:hypothetical protein